MLPFESRITSVGALRPAPDARAAIAAEFGSPIARDRNHARAHDLLDTLADLIGDINIIGAVCGKAGDSGCARDGRAAATRHEFLDRCKRLGNVQVSCAIETDASGLKDAVDSRVWLAIANVGGDVSRCGAHSADPV